MNDNQDDETITTADAEALVFALRAAWAPREIDAEEHEARLAVALGISSENDEIYAALKAAHAPVDLAPSVHDALVAQALVRFDAAPSESAQVLTFGARSKRVFPRVMALASAFAIAAGVFVVARTIPEAPTTISVASGEALVRGDSELSTPGTRTERLARARASDYRENRFRSFGLAPHDAKGTR